MSALETVASMKAEHEAKVAQFDVLSQEIGTDLRAAHDAGFDEGVAQNTSPGDKNYSEEELQAELAPLKSEIASLKLQIDGIPAVVAEAVAAGVKAKGLEIAKKIKDASVDDLAIAAELEA